MAQYVLSYNGMTIPLSRTAGITISGDESEDRIDREFTHITMSFQGVINRSTSAGNTLNNAQHLQAFATTFSEPRGYLRYYMIDDIDGQVTIFESGPNGDDKNGPLVRDVTVNEVKGDSMIITATIEFWKVFCGTNPAVVRSCRWSQSVEIDEDQNSVITTQGYLRIRANSGFSADDFRSAILPVSKKPAGCTRKQRFEQSSDGTKIQFTITDTERYRAPVDGITSWSARWREQSNQDNGAGAIQMGTLSAKAAAPNNITKKTILQFLAQIVSSRVNFMPDTNGKKDLMYSYEFDEGLDTNDVGVVVTVMIVSQQNTAEAMPATTRIGTVVVPLDTSSDKTLPTDRGTLGVRLFAAAINGSCADKTVGTPAGQSPGETEEAYGTTIEIVEDIIETSPNYISDAQTASPMAVYELNVKWPMQSNTIQLPIANGGINNVTSVGCKLAPPTSKLILRWHVERLGAVPDMPTTNLGPNYFFCDESEFMAMEPRLLPDGKTFAYAFQGEWVFGMFEPVQPGTGLFKVPLSPIHTASPGLTATITSGNFTHEVFDG